jgi:hypothetical protein
MLLGFVAVLGAASAFGHPPVSVVVDARGNAYYSDLDQVWRLAPDGTKTVAVPNVHTHELFLDAQGNLYGEHVWYNGDATKTWGHYVWRRAPDGKVSYVIPRRPGFLQNYGFVRDAAGNMYFAFGAEARHEVRKRAPNGAVSVVARGLGDIRWLHATPAGTLYVVDGVDVVRVARDGKVTRLARGLSSTSATRPLVSIRHAVMGIWTDRAENVYVADFAHGAVKRITPRAKVTVVAQSPLPWGPTGGTFTATGDLLLLEASATNQVRVRRVAMKR